MNCFICQHTLTATKDWLYHCPSCDFEQSTLTSGAGRGVDGLETLRRKNFQTIIANLQGLKKLTGMTCLEIGCAEGWFLEAMTAAGVKISAIEASAQALDMQKKGFDVVHGFFPDVLSADQTYDMIVFNDVFEHLPDPVTAIKKCETHLKPGGLLVLNLPNKSGFFYRVSRLMDAVGMTKPFERMWQKGFPSPHMTYFSDKNLPKFVTKYTSLKQKQKFYLSSITKDGLEARVTASYKGALGKAIYLALLVLLPIISLLPQDIMVFVFRKPD